MASTGTGAGLGAGGMRLVSSNRIEGTAILAPDGDKLGTVAALLLDKASGQAAYVVAALGGMLGIGATYHPLPWSLVTYDPGRDAYVTRIDRAVVSGGPSFKSGDDPAFDEAYTTRLHSYYHAG